MADTVRILFFPSLGAGVVCCLLWRRVPDRNHHLGLFLLGAGLFAIPQIYVMAVGTLSTGLLLHRELVMGIWVTLIGAFAAWKAVRTLEGRPLPENPRSQRRIDSPFLMGVIALVFGGFGLYSLWLSAEDLLLPHDVYEAQITRKWIVGASRSGPQYYLGINGGRVEVGRDLYTRVKPGETIQIEITAGSHTVVAAYRGAAPSY